MKKKVKIVLLVLAAVLILVVGSGLGYFVATDSLADADKPTWQVVIEQKVFPLITSAVSAVCSYYVISLPAASRINTAATGFDGAAGGIQAVASAAKESTAAANKTQEELSAVRSELQETHKVLLAVLKMVGLGFSHESELVRNGAAREIMKVEEEYEKKE